MNAYPLNKNRAPFNSSLAILSIIIVAILIFGVFFIYYINKNKDIKQFAQYKINYSEYEREGASLEKLYNGLQKSIGKAPYSLEEFKEYAADDDFLGKFYDNIEKTGLWERVERKMAEKDEWGKKIEESQDPTFIGQGAGKPEEDGGRGQFEHNEFRSPRL